MNGILLKKNAELPSSSEIFILHPDTLYTFLCFGTISLILKHEKRYGELTEIESSHQPRALLKITLLHRFLSFIMKFIVPNRAIHYISFDKTWISILYLYFQKLYQSYGFDDILIQYLHSLPCCWWLRFITCLYKIFKVIH